MKILAILQNAWFRDPEKVQAIFDRHPDSRNKLIASFLFTGCLTGKRLMAAFSKDLCSRIVWEEASRFLGCHSSSRFEPDIEHIKSSIDAHRPDVVVCFGRIAGDAVRTLNLSIPVLFAPHPAARTDPMPELRRVAAQLEQMMEARHAAP